ncbi:MAG: DUF1415 domain-containing protein [Methylomonas sp.]|nr:DUF1415 domain-containing protein [Methylomonas sp.]PPD20385.1 MAG: hypothetical protein CTY23_08905 [Methylomonas sp.]PPD25402.1 MAG: hypothetical protein CTY22_08780 [Methylomonas sp.]PPD35959.1 MAG: hypothetical protein CTY21_08780 [Methylomonas sp.]PPD40536.1 MAG: hypothetical protein CTY17_06020 [Methylomonas sp.]
MSDDSVIKATQTWLTSFVMKYDICPFAAREYHRGSIRYQVCQARALEPALASLIDECVYLDAHPDVETTLLIYSQGFVHFDDYLDLVAIGEQLLADQGYDSIYQLASFHPDYLFASEQGENLDDDPANYTNRSPYPMLHIIREASLERALAAYPDPENIPGRNIERTRTLGLQTLQTLLAASKTQV